MYEFDKYLRMIEPEEVPKYQRAGVKIHQSRGGYYYAIIEPGTNPLRSLKGNNNDKRDSGNFIVDNLIDVMFNTLDELDVDEFFYALEKIENKDFELKESFISYSLTIFETFVNLYNEGAINEYFLDNLIENYFDFVSETYGKDYMVSLKMELLETYIDMNEVLDILNNEKNNISYNSNIYDDLLYIEYFKDNNLNIDADIVNKFTNNLDKLRKINNEKYNDLEQFILYTLRNNNENVKKLYKLVHFFGLVDIVDDDDKYAIEYDKYKSVKDVLNKNIEYYFNKNIIVEKNNKKYIVKTNNIIHKLIGQCYIDSIGIGRIYKRDVFRYINDIRDDDNFKIFEGNEIKVRHDFENNNRLSIKSLKEDIINKYGSYKFDKKFKSLEYGRNVCEDKDEFIGLNQYLGCYSDNYNDRHYSIEWEFVFGDIFRAKIFENDINVYYPLVSDASLDNGDVLYNLYTGELNIGFLRGKEAASKISKLLNIGKNYGLLQNETCGMHIHVEADDVIDKFSYLYDVDKVKIITIISDIINKLFDIGYISEIRKNSRYANYIEDCNEVIDLIDNFENNIYDKSFVEYLDDIYTDYDGFIKKSKLLGWISGGKFFAVKFDKNKKTLEYRVLENYDNSPVKMELNSELALHLTDYIAKIIVNPSDEFEKLKNNEYKLKDVIGEELYEKIEAYSKERKVRMDYLKDIATGMATFSAKEMNNNNLDNNVISFEIDDDTGEMYRIEIDEKGNKKVYNELGKIVNIGD